MPPKKINKTVLKGSTKILGQAQIAKRGLNKEQSNWDQYSPEERVQGNQNDRIALRNAAQRMTNNPNHNTLGQILAKSNKAYDNEVHEYDGMSASEIGRTVDTIQRLDKANAISDVSEVLNPAKEARDIATVRENKAGRASAARIQRTGGVDKVFKQNNRPGGVGVGKVPSGPGKGLNISTPSLGSGVTKNYVDSFGKKNK